MPGSGSLLVGEKGFLYSPNDYGAQFRITPTALAEGQNLTTPEKLPRNGKGDQGMKNEWAEAIKAGKPEIAYSNFDIASLLTEAFLLGNVAIKLGKTIEWEDGNTYPVIDVEISSASHPFYTGKQRILDSAGRVEKFNQRFKNFGR